MIPLPPYKTFNPNRLTVDWKEGERKLDPFASLLDLQSEQIDSELGRMRVELERKLDPSASL